jgi:hypothetical protein
MAFEEPRYIVQLELSKAVSLCSTLHFNLVVVLVCWNRDRQMSNLVIRSIHTHVCRSQLVDERTVVAKVSSALCTSKQIVFEVHVPKRTTSPLSEVIKGSSIPGYSCLRCTVISVRQDCI